MKTLSSNESSNAELAETDANDFHEQLDTGNPDANVNYEAQVDNPVEQTMEQESTQIGEEGAGAGAGVGTGVFVLRVFLGTSFPCLRNSALRRRVSKAFVRHRAR